MASLRRAPLRAFRIADRRHKVFDGEGAAIFGSRLISPGRRVIYACETYAGAMLEVLVNSNIGRMPKEHVWIEIWIGEDIRVEQADLRKIRSWDVADQRASRAFGDQWYDQQRSPVLIVPSTVTCIERNVIVNQAHIDFSKIRASPPKPVIWDERLFR